MVKRPYTEEEKAIAERQLKRLAEQEIPELEHSIEYNELELNKGLLIRYNKAIRDLGKNISAAKKDLIMAVGTVDELRMQMVEGVEIKEITPVTNESPQEGDQESLTLEEFKEEVIPEQEPKEGLTTESLPEETQQ